MDKHVAVEGPVQKFSGQCWEDIVLDIPIEITIVGELDGWTYANVQGDVPIRFLILDPAVVVRTQEPVLL